MQLIATTMEGLEPVLVRELEALGAQDIAQLRRAVSFEGDLELQYKANYTLRTALRVLQPVHQFSAEHEKQLYHGVREIDWKQYLDVKGTLAIDPVVTSEFFKHSQYTALLAKDAIVDQFREQTGTRPDVNIEYPSLRIHLRIHKDQVYVSLDSSGDSLHRRSYRRDTVAAPLNEVLAAGMIGLSGWNGSTPFVDAMCGSGTLPIEAALMAINRPVQQLRERFGFERWPNFDSILWKKVKAEADAAEHTPAYPIIASDKDPRARNATSINVMAAGLERVVRIEKHPFEKFSPPDTPGTLIINPPYDERMSLEDAISFYKSIGDRLKHHWTGWDAWVISGHKEALKHLGLKTKHKIPLLNGAIECGFYHYELF